MRLWNKSKILSVTVNHSTTLDPTNSMECILAYILHNSRYKKVSINKKRFYLVTNNGCIHCSDYELTVVANGQLRKIVTQHSGRRMLSEVYAPIDESQDVIMAQCIVDDVNDVDVCADGCSALFNMVLEDSTRAKYVDVGWKAIIE